MIGRVEAPAAGSAGPPPPRTPGPAPSVPSGRRTARWTSRIRLVALWQLAGALSPRFPTPVETLPVHHRRVQPSVRPHRVEPLEQRARSQPLRQPAACGALAGLVVADRSSARIRDGAAGGGCRPTSPTSSPSAWRSPPTSGRCSGSCGSASGFPSADLLCGRCVRHAGTDRPRAARLARHLARAPRYVRRLSGCRSGGSGTSSDPSVDVRRADRGLPSGHHRHVGPASFWSNGSATTKARGSAPRYWYDVNQLQRADGLGV